MNSSISGQHCATPTIATFLNSRWALSELSAGEERIIDFPSGLTRTRIAYSERLRPAVTVRSLAPDPHRRFSLLRNEWLAECDPFSSSSIDLMASVAYQQIVGMGEKALPYILSDLSSNLDEPNHWFLALAAITGENPIEEAERGRVALMARAWIRWGKENGISV